ncbi:MAG: D-alanyl-D-alanine carboxypeptidase [Candidatus Wildermuthbacteria bacterium]|nr:D-alanyl-D-alanine carboxypeptidase [Candidatus Wildermuthbacteria bacterium]
MPKTAQAITQTEKDLLLQQIEILKQEVSLLQMLLANLQSASDPAGITAQSYLAVNLSDYSVVLEKNQNQPYPIASVAKLMNAVVALENIDKTQTITLTEEMLKPLGSSPSLFRGLTVGAENLLKASLIQSTNDAAEALAYAVGKEKFTNLMNQKAKELGMSNTVFYDTHGLNLANLSTASDLAKLISYIRGYHPEILSITRDNNFWLPDATGRKLKFQNVNNFYPLPAFIGGKAGYLPEARQTLAAVFNVNGDAIVVVVLHSINRQADTFRILNQLGREKLIASRMIQNEKA